MPGVHHREGRGGADATGRSVGADQPEHLAVRRQDLRPVPHGACLGPRRTRAAAGGGSRRVARRLHRSIPRSWRSARPLTPRGCRRRGPPARRPARGPVTERWQWFVPGRLEVFGKHTDYAGGRSLVAAVPRGMTVCAVPTNDRSIVVEDVITGQRALFSVRGEANVVGWRRYVSTVIGRLARNFPEANLAVRIEISSNLPRAAGISSSSALVVGIAEALIARGAIEQTERWKEAIRS